jgi:hypothetical protein
MDKPFKEEENNDQGTEVQAIEPVEQELIAFHGDTLVAVRLADGRIAVVLRWVCENLHLRSHGQVSRIKRTPAIEKELLRVRVETSGGKQTMPALTLRGFPTWILGIHPGEVKEDPTHPGRAEHIREMIIAYQVEAIDVLYKHFAAKAQRSVQAISGPDSGSAVVPLEPMKPEPGAAQHEVITYFENLSLWARAQADRYAQEWRGHIEEWRGVLEGRLEGMEEVVRSVLPDVCRQTLTTVQQANVKGMAKRLADVSGKSHQTIYWDLNQAFEVPSYKDILEADYPVVQHWFLQQIEAGKKSGK